MTDDREPPTQLGKDILKLLMLYGSQMEQALTLNGLLSNNPIETTIGQQQYVREAAQRAVFQTFSEIQEELLSGKDPSYALRNFLKTYG